MPRFPLSLLGGASRLISALLLLPIGVGLLGVVLPAFGYLPVLGGDRFSVFAWQELFEMSGLTTSILLTAQITLVSTAISWLIVQLSLALSWPAGWLQRLNGLLSPILAAPHAALAVGLALLCAPSGLLIRLISPWATDWTRPPDLLIIHDQAGLMLIAGLVIKEAPFLLLMALSVCAQERLPDYLTRARALGYGPVQAWLRVGAPLLRRHMTLPLLTVIAFASSTVDVALILGPNTPPPLAVLIMEQFSDPDLSRRFVAAAGAMLQLGLTSGLVLIWFGGGWLLRCCAIEGLATGVRGAPLRRTWTGSLPSIALASLALGATLCLLLWSIAKRLRFPDIWPDAFSSRAFDMTASRLEETASDTFYIAILATLIALIISLICLEHEAQKGRSGQISTWVLYIPLILPQLPFLFGLQVVGFGLGANGTLPAVVFGHLLFVVPYVVLALAKPYAAIDHRLIATARLLGASAWRAFWRIKLPILLRPLLIATALGISVSFALYLPTVLLGGGRVSTIAIEVVAATLGGDRRIMSGLALAQTLPPMFVFILAWAIPTWVWRDRRALKGG